VASQTPVRAWRRIVPAIGFGVSFVTLRHLLSSGPLDALFSLKSLAAALVLGLFFGLGLELLMAVMKRGEYREGG
jgi:hypothetical protein